MIIMPPEVKPLNLIWVLEKGLGETAKGGLIFAKSVEVAQRLLQLMSKYFPDRRTANYTSDMKPSERRKLLRDFDKGEIHDLVCSDLIARGMDLPSVDYVISYDAPLDMRKYVHRVGRTARAGRAGQAWTLVEKQEVSRAH